MPPSNDQDNLQPLGVSAKTGRPLPDLSDSAIEALLDREKEPKPEGLAYEERSSPAGRAFAVEGEVDPNDLEQAGWGILYGPDVDQKIKETLQPLVKHRESQGARPLAVYDGAEGYRAGDTAITWLNRRGVGLNLVNPDQGVPFYLLIVASPESIPFEFQYTLDLYWGVGRLWFDTPDEFARYVGSVVQYETGPRVPTSRQVGLFAPLHDFDGATQLFNRQVAEPLANGESRFTKPLGTRQRFRLLPFLADNATRSSLAKIFSGDVVGGPPSLLVTGSHGMGFEIDDPRQAAAQGALVCQDWEGLGRITEDHWFAASDLPPDARLAGMIHFLFACYGGATPEADNFDHFNRKPRKIAPRPFFSRLPQAFLSHTNGGGLAVLAHVERAWAYSFQSEKGSGQIQGFRDVLGRLLRGERIGQATDSFNIRWAVLSTQLAERHLELMHGADVPLKTFGRLWVARDDARNFMILGDPAVRLRVEDMPELT